MIVCMKAGDRSQECKNVPCVLELQVDFAEAQRSFQLRFLRHDASEVRNDGFGKTTKQAFEPPGFVVIVLDNWHDHALIEEGPPASMAM